MLRSFPGARPDDPSAVSRAFLGSSVQTAKFECDLENAAICISSTWLRHVASYLTPASKNSPSTQYIKHTSRRTRSGPDDSDAMAVPTALDAQFFTFSPPSAADYPRGLKFAAKRYTSRTSRADERGLTLVLMHCIGGRQSFSFSRPSRRL